MEGEKFDWVALYQATPEALNRNESEIMQKMIMECLHTSPSGWWDSLTRTILAYSEHHPIWVNDPLSRLNLPSDLADMPYDELCEKMKEVDRVVFRNWFRVHVIGPYFCIQLSNNHRVIQNTITDLQSSFETIRHALMRASHIVIPMTPELQSKLEAVTQAMAAMIEEIRPERNRIE